MSDLSIFEKTLKITSGQVTLHRSIRASRLFSLLQDITVQHTTELGMGKDKTLDKGLLWIISQQSIEIEELPAYDEDVLIRSWPGKQLHLLFPRYTEIYRDGRPLIRVKTLWLLIDADTRKAVFPDQHGIHIEGESAPGDFPLPRLKHPDSEPFDSKQITVHYSQTDINRHLSNASYLDIIDDAMPIEYMKSHRIRSIKTEYKEEIHLGQEFTLNIHKNDDEWLFEGISDQGKSLFLIRETYTRY